MQQTKLGQNKLSKVDHLILAFDRQILPVFSVPQSQRQYPAQGLPEPALNEADRRQVEGYMRVNHAGEVSAQALYQGQALTARDESVRQSMRESAREEIEHLAWCRQRLDELGGRRSYLDLFWYLGSLCIGTLAGAVGDKWSLGFIEETEKQVVNHLQGHMDKLPAEDKKTRAILEQMQADEEHHGQKAADSGANQLPHPIKKTMALFSKVMTTLAFKI